MDSLNLSRPWNLLEGECLQILRGMDADSVDAVITDPPYSSGGLHRGDRMKAPSQKYQLTGTVRQYEDFGGDNRDQRSFAFWALLWLGECHRVAKEGAPVCLFSDWRQLPLVADIMQGAGFTWRGVAVWDKSEGTRPTMGRFRAQSEFLVWGSKGAMPLDRGVGCLPGVFRHVVKQADKHHLTGKPTPLMREVVQIAPPGALILDPFAGSGTTGVGALLEGRRFLGIEQNAHYAGVSRERLTAIKTQIAQETPRVPDALRAKLAENVAHLGALL